VLQLAAFQAAVRASTDTAELTRWLDGRSLPPGLALDLDLRWHILVRLATLGGTDRATLRQHLDDEPTAVSRVAHVRALASLPDAEAKAFAWDHFTGGTAAPNYEVEAAGLGMWRTGQEALTQPYVDRYFDELPGTVEVRTGWTLAEAADWFFPMTSTLPATLARAHRLIDDESLEPSLRRVLVDNGDELARRIAIREKFGRP
jgi:aminopeptidase N